MNSRRDQTFSPSTPFAALKRVCECGGTLLPAGYGLVDRSGSIFEVVCRSCGNRSTLRSGAYVSTPCKTNVRNFLGESTVEVIP